MKYKVGDKVRVNDSVLKYMGQGLYEPPPGTIGVIRETVQWPVYGVALDDGIPNPALSGYHEHELDLSED